jgi:gliding motility-associated-like protein
MIKKLLLSFLSLVFLIALAKAQPLNVTGISATGRFTTCNLGLPGVEVSLVSSTGTTVTGGQLVCTDPCGTTTLHIILTNVRWNQTPGVNWIHGIFFPTNSGFTVSAVGLPAGWAAFPGVLGAPCSAAIAGGPGFYYDAVTTNSCCAGVTPNDGIPGNNWGDGLANCNTPAAGYNFDFNLTLCNSAITSGNIIFKVRGTADGGTGCWNVPDNSSHNIQFTIPTAPCSTLYSPLPTATLPVKTCTPALNYTTTLTGTCGNSSTVTWWNAAVGGTQVGTGSPFVYDPPGSACPAGGTLYAACCPSGNLCASRRAFAIPGPCPAALNIDNVAFTNPVCPSQCGNITATTISGALGAVSYTLMPDNITNSTGVFPCVTGANHTLTVTDASGCVASTNIVFTIPICGFPTVTDVSYCQNATAVPLIAATSGTGTNLLWYTTLTGGVGSSIAPTPNTAIVGPTTYYVTQSNAGIESTPRTSLVVTVTALPAAPVVTSPVTYCQNAAVVPLTASGTNLLWYTTATGGTGSATAPTPSTASGGSTIYYVSQTVNTCESPRAAITVNVTAIPTAPTVVTPISYCRNATAIPLTAIGSNLLWYTTATGGTGSTTAPTPSTTAVGSTIYYVSLSTAAIGGCESPRAAITVNIVALPNAPTVTSPVTYCQNDVATALTAIGTNLLWYTVATGGTGSSTAPTPTTTAIGSTTYYVSQTIGICEGARAAIVVNITAPPSAPVVVSPVFFCQGATTASIAGAATGINLLWYTTATGGTGSTTSPTINTSATGSTIYYVTQTAGTCESPRAAITVTINPTPLAPTVSTPVSYCQGATASALFASGSNLLWYTTATGGTGSSIAPTPSTASVGSTLYYVSQTLGICEGPRAVITVTVTATPPAPTVTTPVLYCQNDVATDLTATGTNLLWYTTATGGTGTATAPTPITTALGSTNYYVSSTIGICEGPRALITVTITLLPTTPLVTTPVNYCQGATSSVLTATGTNLLWYTTATGGTGSSTAPTPSTASVGSTVYYVSQVSGSCESPRAAITVNINTTPALPLVTTPVNYCQGAPTTALTATGTNLLWYTTATGGTGSATAPTPSSAAVGSVIYYVSSTIGTCESARSAITVNVSITPGLPTVTTPVTYCQGATAAALVATGTNLLWYTTATGGTGSATTPTPSTATVGNTIYYVSSTIGICEGLRAAIIVDIVAPPAAPIIITPILYCQGSLAADLSIAATGTNLLWYTTATGGTGSILAPTPSTVSAGNTIYYVSQTIGTCESPRAAITVTVNLKPLAPVVTTPVVYCQGATSSALFASGSNLLWYTTATGGVGSSITPVPSTASIGSTIYYVTQSNAFCESVRTSITVNVNTTAAAPTVTSPIEYCLNATAIALTATGTNLLWYTTATGGTGVSTLIPPTNALGNITYYVSSTIGICEGARTALTVTVNPLPATPVVTTPVEYCNNATSVALTATGSNLLWYSLPVGGTGSVIAPIPSTVAVGTTIYYVSQTINNCEGSRAAITVTIKPNPAVPTITSVPPTCLVPGTSTISNYTAVNTYTFTPAGPTATATGLITGMTIGTSYTVTSTSGTCLSAASLSFSNAATLITPAVPTITSAVPTCAANGTSTISNYNAANTYTFTPTGPTATVTGLVTGMTIGTSYTVTAGLGICTSLPSLSFSNATILVTPAIPTIASVAPTCVVPGTSTISNYNAANTYTFTPTGPTVGAGGLIASMVIGTSYTVTSGNATCTSLSSASFSNAGTLITPAVPTITPAAPTCLADGTSTISNYNAANTYTFTPTGPTATVTGLITGMIIGTSYTVTAGLGICTSLPSLSFNNAAILVTPAVPTITSVPPTCAVPGTSTISNYNAANTYTFTPAGPTATGTGLITGMVIGTSYTVTSGNATCTSLSSASFSNAATLITPAVPTITSAVPTCASNGTSAISNYNAANTYTFTPAGPTVTGTGLVTGMTIGTSYTVTAGLGICTSLPSASFSNAATLITPAIPTIASVAPTCLVPGTSTISNYNAANTYTFTPVGPTATGTGLITGMVISTSYTVTSGNATCTSLSSASFSNAATLITPAIPTITSAVPTCASNGTSTISNYNGANTYTFTPTGPTATGTGLVTGMTIGTSYTVTAGLGICTSLPSVSFSNAAILITPAVPTIASVAPTCVVPGTSTISNYNAANTYTFTPVGPTATGTGLITGMVIGTSYTVTSGNATCTSLPSASFSNAATLITPAIPTITSTAPTCAANGISTISNYSAANTYTFTPAGPTVGAGGLITGMLIGTSYTVTSSLGICTSLPSASFSNAAMIVSPAAPLVTSAIAYCQNAPTIALTATGTNLLWYTVPVGGTSSNIAPIPSSAIAGVTTYYVSQTALTCEGPRAAIAVTITATPLLPTVNSPINYCPGDPSTQLSAIGTNLLWYTVPLGGTGSTVAPTPSTAIPGSFIFYVSQSTNVSPSLSCEGPRAVITVNVNNNNLTVNIGKDTTICEGESVKFSPIVNPTPPTIIYQWRAIGVPNSTIDNRATKDIAVNPVDNAQYILNATIGGCATEDTVNVNVRWKPILDVEPSKAICLLDSALIKSTVTHFNSTFISTFIDFTWTPTDSLRSPNTLQTWVYPIKSTWYKLTATTTKLNYGCDFVVSDSIKIVVQPIVKAFAGNDTIAVKDIPHQLYGTGGIRYEWSSPSGARISNPIAQNPFATLYNDANFYLKVTDAIGCAGYDSIFVKVYNGPTYYVPNAFSPNGDGLNDIFRVIPVGISNTVYFRVFNRFGEVVFETNQWLKGWDGTFKGKPQPSGAYVWMVSGTDRDYKKVEMKGTVMVVR